ALLIAIVLLFWNPSEPKASVVNPAPHPVVHRPVSRPAVVIPTIAVSFDSIPWAEIEISGGSLKEPIRETTPCRVALAPAQYNITLKNPELAPLLQSINVSLSNHDFRFQFPKVNPEKLADSAQGK